MWRKSLLFTLLLAVMLAGVPYPAGADFYVVPVPTGSVGTPITSVPYTISAPGFYYLKRNLNFTGASGHAITIDVDNVTLDLMGFTLSGPGKNVGTSNGIFMDGRKNVTIRNGTIRDFGDYGVHENDQLGNAGENHVLIGLRTLNNGDSGIEMFGSSHLVNGCVSTSNSRHGIYVKSGSAVINSLASGNGLDGIYVGKGSTVQGCTVRYNNNNGIYAGGHSTIVDNTSTRNGQEGIDAYIYSTVSRNTVTYNGLSGIYLATACTASGNTVTFNNQNEIASPAHAGIRVGHMSIVKSNTLYSNNIHNIYVWAHDNAIEENLVTGSTYGIYFDGGGNFWANNRASGNTTNYHHDSVDTDGGGNYSF